MTTMPTPLPREAILQRFELDLIGPAAPDEVLMELPVDRYLTGMLWPKSTTLTTEEDESMGNGAGDDDDESGEEDQGVRLSGQAKPSSMGLSFTVRKSTREPALSIEISLGVYAACHLEDGKVTEGPAPRFRDCVWQRTPYDLALPAVSIRQGYHKLSLPGDAPRGLELHCQAMPDGEDLLVTLALVNANQRLVDEERVASEQKSFLQVSLSATGHGGTQIVARPFRTSRSDEDGRMASLIYRDVTQYAVGHTCSAAWSSGESGIRVATAWIPNAVVPSMDPKGGVEFAPLSKQGDVLPLSANWLATAKVADLAKGLAMLPQCYADWVKKQEGRIPQLPERLRDIAAEQLDVCRDVQKRMAAAVAHLADDEDTRRCFQLANQAIALARKWSGRGEDLTWRPFQLGFILLSLESIADPTHKDREVMDLLWFPTGGGKTEAYLGLIAFLLFHRRLRCEDPEVGAGTAAIMRYTLRALTIQQFQRAAGVVLACEQIRRRLADTALGMTPFSIGLWVGGGATPNTVEDAAELAAGSNCDHRQLENCPCCGSKLTWSANPPRTEMTVRCNKGNCTLASASSTLPVYTIDEDIYRVVPSLLIGTVDKFAQLVRKQEVGRFFAIDSDRLPPDLIVQDELHLISGPLGTIAGLYEVAIDHLCSRDGVRPKVIGSTATIRRAGTQIRALFDRRTCQFPPPGLDHDDSGFAVVDREAAGRLYVGVTSAGRSPKYTLQSVSASLLQSATSPEIPQTAQESYSTLLVYFNSLRELGGALVLMQDDVKMTIGAYAQRHGEQPRRLEVPEELTSRKSASEIRDLLKLLEKRDTSPEVLLASNMISVGVDIQRLALMVVNGQPKTIAEYIQATSRVGRGDTAGLVVTVYNSSRTRDRSHYETFNGWHTGLYREVEATSVTPFAARAVDKAIHSALVALARHLVPRLRTNPRLTAESVPRVRELGEVLLARVRAIDPDEEAAVRSSIDRLIADWIERQDVEEYWVDTGNKVGLMISAEQHAAMRASGARTDRAWPTLNSMRDVEPSTEFRLLRPATPTPTNAS